MKLPETKSGLLFERDAWEGIINSPSWVVYRNSLKEHVAYLQDKINSSLRQQKNIEAYGFLIAMDDCNKFLDSINVRLKALNEQIEKGGNNANRI